MSMWITEVQMSPLYPEDTGIISTPHEDFLSARRAGMSLACCRGTQKVRVLAPNGEVHCTYDRADNQWLNVHPDSKAIAAQEYREIIAHLHSPEYQEEQRLKALENIRRWNETRG